MRNVETEFTDRAVDFIERAVAKNKASAEDEPFFMWYNSTRGHVWIHLNEKYKNKTGNGMFADGMAELDDKTGEILDKLEELKIADNTIVIWTSDNGKEIMTGPDMSGMDPFKGEKGLTLEGGFRVPLVVSWPGKIKPGSVINGMMSHIDWMPTCWPRPMVARIRVFRRSC